MATQVSQKNSIIETGVATGRIDVDGNVRPITVIGNRKIRETFEPGCVQQAVNSASAPGIASFILNPDAHFGYGAPVGCTMVSPTHIYPGPVGVDIKCSMSLLQLDLPEEAVADKRVRRQVINEIELRTPTGAGKGQRSVPLSRAVSPELGRQVVTQGANPGVLDQLGIPVDWAERCEDAYHMGHDRTRGALESRLDMILGKNLMPAFEEKIRQLGSYGGGNHFGECEVVEVANNDRARAVADTFGLSDGGIAFLSHCGSRGFGYQQANRQFKTMESYFESHGIDYPAGDRHLVYAELGSDLANDYLDDMALAANFATVNHLLINALVLEAFQTVFTGVTGRLVYFISHNIAREEPVDGKTQWVHRKGATRAFPAGHRELAATPFAETGHPILLPGNPQGGSAVMVADPGAELSAYSVNHGAGRVMGRRNAYRTLDQREIDASFADADIVTNCRFYPRDEAPAVYKNFDDVIDSVKTAGLASEVARLRARFVIKDADNKYGGAA